MVTDEEYYSLFRLFIQTATCLSKAAISLTAISDKHTGPALKEDVDRDEIEAQLQHITRALPTVYGVAMRCTGRALQQSGLFKLPSDIVQNILRRLPTHQIVTVSRHFYVTALATRAELRVTSRNEHMLALLPELSNVRACNAQYSRCMARVLPFAPPLRKLRRLDLSHARLGPRALAALPRLRCLEDLNLASSSISALVIAQQTALYASVCTLTTLKSLDLSNNSLVDVPGCVPALAEHLPQLRALTRLSLDSMGALGPDRITTLAPALAQLPTLIHLSMNDLRAGPRGATALARALLALTALRTLNLIGNKLGSDGVVTLAPAFALLESLEELRLSCNAIGPEGARELAAPLGQLLAMQRLRLDRNCLGPDGAAHLVDPLSRLSALCFLSLSANGIGPEMCANISSRLSSLSITTLNLLDNGLRE